MEKKDKLTMEVPEPSIREREQTELSQSEVRAKVNLVGQCLLTHTSFDPNASPGL